MEVTAWWWSRADCIGSHSRWWGHSCLSREHGLL